ncbi:MAG: AMP-binding protein [Methyloligellaceae bacterium]
MTETTRIRSLSDIIILEQQALEQFVKAESVYNLIERASETYGKRDAFRYLPDGNLETVTQNTTFTELFQKVTQAANLFHSLNIGPEDSVAILAPNIPEAQFALWGAETATKACPVNFMLETGHIIEIMEQANAKAIVCLGHDDDLPILQKATEIAEKTGLKNIFTIGGDNSGFRDFLNAINEQRSDKLLFDRALNHATIAALFHTGGTTGVPKLARHTHGNQLFTSYCAALYYDLKSEDIVINGFPMFHVAGTLVYGTSCFTVGATQILTTRTGYRNAGLMQNIWRHIEQQNVTIFSCVPTILSTLLQTEPGNADLSSLKAFYTGGSPLPAELADAIENKFSVPVRNIFGMTECAGLLALEPIHAPRTPGAAGYRLPFTEIHAFSSSDDGNINLDTPCQPGQTGILAIRSPNVGPGYTDSKRNTGSFENGWLISGDIGMVDEKGRVFVTGREKDVIIRGAHNIDPASIEEAINSHPAISICAAIGQPDTYAGEIPVVYAELKEGITTTPEEILQFSTPLIPEPAARPKRLEFVEELPKTAIGKIFKPQIRCWATQYAFSQSLSSTDFDGQIIAALENGQITVTIVLSGKTTDEQINNYKKTLQNYSLKYQFVENN